MFHIGEERKCSGSNFQYVFKTLGQIGHCDVILETYIIQSFTYQKNVLPWIVQFLLLVDFGSQNILIISPLSS